MMHKRGQVFTVLAIVIILLMFVSFEIFSIIHERQAIRTRVSTMDSFLHSIEKNLERQMYISGFRILFLAENEITTSAEYIDVEEFFNEGFFNGTVNGIPNDILIGATYEDLINSVNDKANKINAEVKMSDYVFEIGQDDPWHVKFSISFDFVMSDLQDLAKWEKTQNITAFIPIAGFQDPIYILNTGAQVSRTINQTIYEGNYVNAGDVTNLSLHVEKGYYAANSNAPSFLNRLEGNFTGDVNGIESFVKIPELPGSVETKTCIDYFYFSSSNPSASTVTGMPSWFRIDDGHKIKYQIS